MNDPIKGSIWIVVNVNHTAACPHCEVLSWHTKTGWSNKCEHVVGPGSQDGKLAVIFKGQK